MSYRTYQKKIRRCRICKHQQGGHCNIYGGGLTAIVWRCIREKRIHFDPKKPRIEYITERRVRFDKERMEMGRARGKNTVVTISTYYCFEGGDKLAEILSEATGMAWRFVWNYMDTAFFEAPGPTPDSFEITIPWKEKIVHWEDNDA
jgi:hypothetical protein